MVILYNRFPKLRPPKRISENRCKHKITINSTNAKKGFWLTNVFDVNWMTKTTIHKTPKKMSWSMRTLLLYDFIIFKLEVSFFIFTRPRMSSEYLLLLLGMASHPFSLYPYDTTQYPLIKFHTNPKSLFSKQFMFLLYSIKCILLYTFLVKNTYQSLFFDCFDCFLYKPSHFLENRLLFCGFWVWVILNSRDISFCRLFGWIWS